MQTRSLRAWVWVHKWSSLVCTVFMLLLCLTGLPLIFHHEISHWLGTDIESPPLAPDAARISLDRVIAAAQAQHPERVVQYVSQDDEHQSIWFVTLTPAPAPTDDFRSVVVDAVSGQIVAQPRFDQGFLWVMHKLHVDLFAGLAGKLFLGLMGLLLLVAIVSGVVLYGPFMRKLDFGSVRRHRQRRLAWLDLHNLLGIVTVVWLFVVGATGMINTWADLLIKVWQQDQLSALLAPYQGQATVPPQARVGAARAGCRPGPGARHAAVLHRVSRHGVFQPAPPHRLPARHRTAHSTAALPGAGGCPHGRSHRGTDAALVSDGTADLPAAAFW